MKLAWRNSINLVLTTSILACCAGIPGNNVKLENYPKIDQLRPKELNLSYEKIRFDEKSKGDDFNDKIIEKLTSATAYPEKENHQSDCHVMISSNNDYGKSKVCQAFGILAGFTLFIVPAYCYWKYQANATLISHPKDSEIKGIIKTSIAEAKIGDIFLDENNSPARLLKTYEIKDKVHEVWSSLMVLAAIPITSLRKTPTPNAAKAQTENTISEALTRQILHDASQSEECRKK